MKKTTQDKRTTDVVTSSKPYSIGIDLGDKFSQFCILDKDGEVIEEGRLRTTIEAFKARFERIEPLRIAIEAGTHRDG